MCRRLVCIHNTRIIEHHPLIGQRQYTVSKSCNHLFVHSRNRLSNTQTLHYIHYTLWVNAHVEMHGLCAKIHSFIGNQLGKKTIKKFHIDLIPFRGGPSPVDALSWWEWNPIKLSYITSWLSLWQARRSGTHYRLNFVICLSVLVTLDAALRRYCLRDISALSAIEMRCIILRYIHFLFYSGWPAPLKVRFNQLCQHANRPEFTGPTVTQNLPFLPQR